jgi:hypothetical protein
MSSTWPSNFSTWAPPTLLDLVRLAASAVSPLPQKPAHLFADGFPLHEGLVGLVHVAPRPQIAFGEDVELLVGVGLGGINALEGRLPFEVILAEAEFFHPPGHGQDVGLEFADRAADRERMFVEILGVLPEEIRLDPGQRAEERHEGEDDAEAQAQLGADPDVFEFHGAFLPAVV